MPIQCLKALFPNRGASSGTKPITIDTTVPITPIFIRMDDFMDHLRLED